MTETATSIRYKIVEQELAFNRLSRYPYEQAEAIANHYARHSILARDLLRLLELRGEAGMQVDRVIAFGVRAIKEAHRTDFGIELEWPQPARTSENGTPVA